MKLSEARYAGGKTIVWWVTGLGYHEILDHTTPPFIDPTTKTLVIAIDAEYEGSYFNPATFDSEELKWDINWAVEIAGTESQLTEFLKQHWVHVDKDQITVTNVWDDNGLDRITKHIEKKKNANPDKMNEQVSRILEAKYYRDPTPLEVYEIYADFVNSEQKSSHAHVHAVEHDFHEHSTSDRCYAIMYVWITDRTTKEAEEDVRKFAEMHQLPFTGIDVDDDGVLSGNPSFKHSRLHGTIVYAGGCPDHHITEAKHHGQLKADAITRHQVWYHYKKHKTEIGSRSDPSIQIRQRDVNRHIVPTISFWYYRDITEQEAVEHAKGYMRDNNLPYTSHQVQRNPYGKSLAAIVVFRFGEKEDLKEARHASTNLSVNEVMRKYMEIEKDIRSQNKEHYSYYDSESTGRITMTGPHIDTEYSDSPTAEFGILVHHADSQQEAAERMYNFIKHTNIPYNDIEFGTGDVNDEKYAFIIQYRNAQTDPRLTEASRHMTITNKDAQEVFYQYEKNESHHEDTDDEEWLGRMMKGDLSDVFGDPTLVADLRNDDGDGLYRAELSSRWVLPAPKEMDSNAEKERARQFMLDLNLPYTRVETSTRWNSMTHPTDSKKVISIQMTEAMLVFKATDK